MQNKTKNKPPVSLQAECKVMARQDLAGPVKTIKHDDDKHHSYHHYHQHVHVVQVMREHLKTRLGVLRSEPTTTLSTPGPRGALMMLPLLH